MEVEEILANSFYDASLTLISTQDKDILRKLIIIISINYIQKSSTKY